MRTEADKKPYTRWWVECYTFGREPKPGYRVYFDGPKAEAKARAFWEKAKREGNEKWTGPPTALSEQVEGEVNHG